MILMICQRGDSEDTGRTPPASQRHARDTSRVGSRVTLTAWNCRSSRRVLVLGEPGRTAVWVPPGSSSVMNLLGLSASTSRRGLASLCFRKLWKQSAVLG